MIRLCAEAGLPEPEFRPEGERFITILWRDWLTEKVLSSLNLNDRHRRAIALARREGRVTNASYQQAVGGSRRTALRELDTLARLGVFESKGKGRGAHYALATKKRATNAPNAPSTRTREGDTAQRKGLTKGSKGSG